MYGDGATYDAIEGRFRIIRKEAEKLKSEITTGERAPAPPRGSATSRSPRKNRQHSVIDSDGVETGRISKPSSKNNSPTKRRTAAQVKRGLLDASASASTSASASASASSNGDASHSGIINSDVDETYIPAASAADLSFEDINYSFQAPDACMTIDPNLSWLQRFDDFGEELR